MDLKKLDYKKINHYRYFDTFERYFKKSEEPINLELDELKSVLSYTFAFLFHKTENEKNNKDIYMFIQSNKPNITNATLYFGRYLIENLEGFNKEWLLELQQKTYEQQNFYINPEFVDFVHEALLDYMPARSIEYGKYFLHYFNKEMLAKSIFAEHKDTIFDFIQNDKNSFDKIVDILNKESEIIFSFDDKMLLMLTYKNNLNPNRCNQIEYGLIANIAKHNIMNIVLRNKFHIDLTNSIFKDKLKIDLKRGNNNNKGRGGFKR